MKKIIFSLFLILPLSAFAEGSSSGSEFFHQAAGGQHEVTPKLNYSKLDYSLAGTDITAKGYILSAEYEYGLMPELALGGRLAYSSQDIEITSTPKTTASGLNDLVLFAKANMPAGPGSLRYGAELSLSPGNSKTESNGDTNAYTGGHTLAPYFGYEYNAAPCVFGAKLAVEIGLGDRTDEASNGTKTKSSGDEDTTFSLFYEHEFNADMKIGASLDWVTTSDTKDVTANTTSENVSPTQNLNVYLPTKMGKGTLLPKLSYGMTTADKVNGSKVDSYKVLALEAGYRMEF